MNSIDRRRNLGPANAQSLRFHSEDKVKDKSVHAESTVIKETPKLFIKTGTVCSANGSIYQSVSALQKQRQYILNYCSHLMNTDFSIASFFIAERHNTMSATASQSDFYYGRKKLSESSTTSWYLDSSDEEKQLIDLVIILKEA